jgi:hypothetical protein
MMRRFPFLAAILTLVACATSPGGEALTPAPPAPLEPVGSYTFSSVFEGQPIAGTIVIRATEDGYTGLVDPKNGPPQVPVYAVTVEGQTMTLFGDAGGDDLVITMEFTGDRFTGSWVVGFDGGEISGMRVPAEP